MTREEMDFIGSMNMCDEISNEAYKKIMTHCEEQEPCEDCISREEAIRMFADDDYTVNELRNLPSVIPQSKTGRWILSGGYWRCSECKEKALLKLDKAKGNCKEYMPIKSKYCPNCGEKMEVEE